MKTLLNGSKKSGLGWMAALAGMAVVGTESKALAQYYNPGRQSIFVNPVIDRGGHYDNGLVCEMVPQRVWREPVFELRKVRVDIPAKVVQRHVPRYYPLGRFLGYELVTEVIEPARVVWKNERVMVRAGFHETVMERVCRRAARGPDLAHRVTPTWRQPIGRTVAPIRTSGFSAAFGSHRGNIGISVNRNRF